MSEYVTKEELFSQPVKRRFTDAIVQGKKFRIRTLTAGEMNPWAVESQNPDGEASAGPRLIVLMVVDGDGQLVFTKDDAKKFMEMDASFVAELAQKCQEFAGQLSQQQVDEIEKN